jgi:hypothetical protein
VVAGVLATVVAAAGLVGVLLFTRLDPDKITRIAELQFELATGRDASIAGPAEIVFWPVPGVRTGPVAVRNPGWTRSDHLIAARSLLLALDWKALLTGALRPGHMTFTEAQISIEMQPDGTPNWALPERSGDNARLTLSADRAEVTVHVPALGLDGTLPSVDAHLALAAANMDRTEIALTFTTEEDQVHYAGFAADASETIAATGKLSARLAQPSDLLARMGQPLSGVSADVTALEGEGRIDTTGERLRMTSRWAADLGGSKLSADLGLKAETGWAAVRDGTAPARLDLIARGAGVFSAYLNGPVTLGAALDGEFSLAVLDLAAFSGTFGIDVPQSLSAHRNAVLTGTLEATPTDLDAHVADLKVEGPPTVTPVFVSADGTGAPWTDIVQAKIRDVAVLGGAFRADLFLPGEATDEGSDPLEIKQELTRAPSEPVPEVEQDPPSAEAAPAISPSEPTPVAAQEPPPEIPDDITEGLEEQTSLDTAQAPSQTAERTGVPIPVPRPPEGVAD